MTYNRERIIIFAASIIDTSSGLTGFDSELEWYVSMQCVGNLHLNISYQAIIWQQYLCSRSVIEVQ